DLWHSGAGGLRCGLGQRHPVIVGCGYGCRSRWRGSMKGRVVLLGAPLGNPADASSRFRETLATADLVAAEDTRRLMRLARDLGITIAGTVVSYFEGNEVRRTPELVAAAQAGSEVALVTDGGMPSVSDPG